MKPRESLEGLRCQIGTFPDWCPGPTESRSSPCLKGDLVRTPFDTGGERLDGPAEEVPYAGSLFQCYSCPRPPSSTTAPATRLRSMRLSVSVSNQVCSEAGAAPPSSPEGDFGGVTIAEDG